jgi:hypothetical protein
MRDRKLKLVIASVLLLAWGVFVTNVRAQNATVFPGDTWVRISAFTNQPLAGADVAVFDTDGRLLFQRVNATNAQGIYPAKVRNLSRNFRVVVVLDANGQPTLANLQSLGVVVLSADARDFDPARDIVFVNPVTTMVSGLLLARPRLGFEQAQLRVRRYLGMPDNASLGAALREEPQFQSAYFSESTFLNLANRHGGMVRFLEALLADLVAHPKAVHRFPASGLKSSSGDVTSLIAESLVKGALSWAGGEGAGWVAQSAGLTTPGATAAQVAQLQKSLDALQSSVDQLSKQLDAATQEILAELTQTQYSAIATQALALASDVNVVENNLTYYALGCPTVPEDGVPVPVVGDVPDDWCADQKDLVDKQLGETEINGAYEKLASAYLLDTQVVGYKGMLHLFSQATGQSVRFFRPADSAKIQNMFAYWDAIETEAANLKVELMHLNGAQNNPNGGVKQITDFLGNPDLDPPTTGEFQATHAGEAKLVWPALPADTVIDTKSRVMWATGIPKDTIYDFGNGNTITGCAPGLYGGPSDGWSGSPSFGTTFNGISGWASPSLGALQALIDGWSGNASSPMSWLIAETQAVAPDSPTSAGFYNILACSQGLYNFVWTSTNQGTTNPNFYSPYAVVDMRSGTVPAKGTYPYGEPNWLFLTRTLGQGEQYYWYP